MADVTSSLQDGNDATGAIMPFAPSHLAAAVGLSRQMSWPYRLQDWEFAARIGQGLALEKAGALIGTAMWWPYGDDFASAGMIIIAKSEQGRGHGARLFDALLAAAAPRSLMLNSTAEGLPLYQKRGFMAVGTIHQHQGVLLEQGGFAQPPDIRRGRPVDFVTIAELDCDATGLSRPALLDHLLAAGEVVVIERGDRLAGYAIARAFGRGQVIGPVVAENASDARQLIKALLHKLAGAFVRLDVPAGSGLGTWLDAQGVERVGEATTMVLGHRPVAGGPLRTFAIANQSFG
ncbi:GNAT family N-acetyltransferase [Bosea vaviloviae]|uniref:GNAT family N-acetyltransferase n=2 Tax=Bosea vaviloviae TaxID=1526658 RepID=A0A1D7U664_9HYPH|nr:GNAT family N-acetyltransferase [Bosea vaviloviae]